MACKTCFLVTAKDVKRLHEKFEYLVKNLRIRVEMGQKGRVRAMRLYDEVVVINRQLELISQYAIVD